MLLESDLALAIVQNDLEQLLGQVDTGEKRKVNQFGTFYGLRICVN